EYVYDGDGNVITFTDRRGVEFHTTYDNLNRVLTREVVEKISNSSRVLPLESDNYTDAANQVAVIDANGHTTTTVYDGLGRPLTVTAPPNVGLNQTIFYAYDGVNLRSVIDRNDNETTYKYDALNRLRVTKEYQ